MYFFATEQIDSQRLSSICICTDGAPAMSGCRSGFVSRVKGVAPHITNTHCMIHREALASNTLPASLNDVLKDVIQMVNFVKASALSTRLFHNLCSTMEPDHQKLLFHTKVRWLSKGSVLNHFLELNVEIQEFLAQRGKFQWAANMNYGVSGCVTSVTFSKNLISSICSFRANKLTSWNLWTS